MTYRFYITAMCAVLAATGAYAESLPRLPANRETSGPKAPRAGGALRGPMGKGAGAPVVERLMNMNPEQRKKALQKLPPERRQHLEARLLEYDRLTPAQKVKLQGQYQSFRGLPVDQQARLRKLYQRFNNFPLERQDALRTEVQNMQALSAPERRARMNSDEFRNLYNQREQALLAELAKAVPSN